MAWFCFWMIALCNSEQTTGEATCWMKPARWTGNYWGPEATRARLTGELPPLPTNPMLAQWGQWGRRVLRDGDIVFRLGDARIVGGMFPLSWFIARSSGSRFSHTGIVAIEDGNPVVYDCSSEGVRRQPFEVWMLDCVRALGVKRLKPEYRRHIPGVLGYCRGKFEEQVPFDSGFRLDDTAFYCLELTEKAFRSQGLALSQPVRIGDWEHLTTYPLTVAGLLYGSGLVLDPPYTLEQAVFLPGNERHGVWASALLETVFENTPPVNREAAPGKPDGLSMRGDVEMAFYTAIALRRSYRELPLRWLGELVQRPQVQGMLADDPPSPNDSLKEVNHGGSPRESGSDSSPERSPGT
jgi:hypothetical protein